MATKFNSDTDRLLNKIKYHFQFCCSNLELLLTITKLTNDTAFNDTFHAYIKPAKSTMIIKDVIKIITDENMLKSVKINDATNTTANELPIDINTSVQMSKYCSKNT